MEYRIPKQGECYRHFKGDRCRVLAVATHTETGEEMVVYEGLYGEHPVYVRPLELFVGRVDKERFPNVEQEYRFELEEETAVPDQEEQMLIFGFLDRETAAGKLEYLQSVREQITGEFLETAAQSLDFTENEGSVQERFDELISYLKTVEKYEGGRFR